SLVFLGQRSNESTGVDGLGGATGVVIDDALGQVYVAGTLQGALVHFVRHADSFCPPSGSGALDGVPIDIAAGGSVTFRIDVDVSASLSGPLVNVASVDALQDPNPDNDSAEDVDVQ